jgi:hypothetical protein
VKLALAVITAFSAVAVGTALEPAVFVGSAAWRPSRPSVPVNRHTPTSMPLGGTQFLTVQPGDTIAMTTSIGAESACFKAIGSSRIVALACGGPRGFHVFLRAYHGKVAPANATLGDTLALSLPVPLATLTNACDTALALAGGAYDSTVASRPAQCNAPPPTTSVASITLNSNPDGVFLAGLSNGTTINLATLPTRDVNIGATVMGVASRLDFQLDAFTHSEATAPYALCGDWATCPAGTFSVGSHVLTITPFDASGVKGAATTLMLRVIDSAGVSSVSRLTR